LSAFGSVTLIEVVFMLAVPVVIVSNSIAFPTQISGIKAVELVEDKNQYQKKHGFLRRATYGL
jgi:hypothetical protein